MARLLFGWLGLGVALAIVACNAQIAEDVPKYGPPNGLAGKNPDPNAGAPVTPQPTGDGGSITPASCTAPTTPPAADCPKYSTDIWTLMSGAAPAGWECNKSGCHSAGATPPDLSTAAVAYTAMEKWIPPNLPANKRPGKPYINPKCTELTESRFPCHMAGVPAAEACGSGSAMPIGGTNLQGVDKLNKWIQCGSPNN